MPSEKPDLCTPLAQELPTTENGLVDSVMDKEYKNGVMVLFILENGTTTELKAKENLFTLTETYMKELG